MAAGSRGISRDLLDLQERGAKFYLPEYKSCGRGPRRMLRVPISSLQCPGAWGFLHGGPRVPVPQGDAAEAAFGLLGFEQGVQTPGWHGRGYGGACSPRGAELCGVA